MPEPRFVAAIDQGTTSTRCMIFDHAGRVVAMSQREHEQIFPQAGWVEHDAMQIWDNTRQVCAEAVAQIDLATEQIAAVGVTNQRETTVVWEKTTGEPVCNAIVWQDMRTAALCEDLAGQNNADQNNADQSDPDRRGVDRFAAKTGLPLSTYFSAPKVAWILDNVTGARARAERGELLFGTIDSWLIWNMTGGVRGGLHLTDVTNASRTMLMDLATCDWDDELLAAFGIPRSMLPHIRSSSGDFGQVRNRGALAGVPITAALGDQQAAMFGQTCFSPGDAKNTYGTGNFLLVNTGEKIVRSEHGLLTTVCYRIGDQPPVYALEGSIPVTGALVQWLRDNLGIISDAPQIEELAAAVPDNGDVYVVPAFSGLYAPRWRPDARGVIVGLTRFANKSHIARAALESVAFQTREVIDAINADAHFELRELKVDGGMTGNDLLMQLQADIADVTVVRPQITETTALGAAYAAGLATGFWRDLDDLRRHWHRDATWQPQLSDQVRDKLWKRWNQAVARSTDWASREPDSV